MDMKKTGYELKSDNIIIVPSDENDVWNKEWIISLKDEITKIGTVTFEGTKAYGAVPISVTLEDRYQNKGYGTTVFKLMTNWAFLHKNVYEIKAECEHENDKCIHAMERAGYVYRSIENNIESYSIMKPKSTWLSLYLIIGIVVGLVLGIVVGNQWIGMAIGVIAGVLIGANIDSKLLKDREKVIGKR